MFSCFVFSCFGAIGFRFQGLPDTVQSTGYILIARNRKADSDWILYLRTGALRTNFGNTTTPESFARSLAFLQISACRLLLLVFFTVSCAQGMYRFCTSSSSSCSTVRSTSRTTWSTSTLASLFQSSFPCLVKEQPRVHAVGETWVLRCRLRRHIAILVQL